MRHLRENVLARHATCPCTTLGSPALTGARRPLEHHAYTVLATGAVAHGPSCLRSESHSNTRIGITQCVVHTTLTSTTVIKASASLSLTELD